MTAADTMKLLLDMDEQIISPRPSHFGRAAMTIFKLADKLAQHTPDAPELGKYLDVDLTPVTQYNRTPSEKATLTLAEETERLASENARLTNELEALKAAIATPSNN